MMMKKIQLLLALSAVLLATSGAARSLKQDPLTHLASSGLIPQRPSDSTTTTTTTDPTTTTTNNNQQDTSSSSADASAQAASTTNNWIQPPPQNNNTWPMHNTTLPQNVTIQIKIEEKKKEEEKKEEIPECSGAAASCCAQSINVIRVDDHTTVPVPGQNCTYTEEIQIVTLPACSDMHCWWNCGSKCADKAVVETSYVNQTLSLLVTPYPPATWAVKDKAKCVCSKPKEQEVTVTATATATASANSHN